MSKEEDEKVGEKPTWRLMVHMTADAPNLQEPLRLDLEELSRPLKEMGVESAKRIIVLAQIDTASGVSKRFRLTHDKPDWLATFPTSKKTSVPDFVNAMAEAFPSERAALVLWGHGRGVGSGFEPVHPTPGHRGAEAPDNRLMGVKVEPVGEAQHHIHLLGVDACYMASAELLYQVRKKVSYALVPQGNINLRGWHYDQFVDVILSDPTIEARALGENALDQVGLSHTSPSQLSLLSLGQGGSQGDILKGALQRLVTAIDDAYRDKDRDSQTRNRIHDAFCEAAWAGARQFLDLASLCQVLASRIPVREVRRAALGLLLELVRETPAVVQPNRLVLDQLSVLSVPLGGLSLYCPWPRATSREVAAGARNSQVDPGEYGKLDLPKDTGWANFVFDPERMREAERRWVRREAQDQVDQMAAEIHGVRAGDPKPPGRAGDPKPPGRAGDPKPPGRGGDPKPAGRGDDFQIASWTA